MTQEDKELLLKDLCARLPYETMFYSNSNGDECLLSIDLEYCKINELYTIEQIKPYLRPMSSMTGEEFEEYGNITEHISIGSLDFNIANPNAFDWLNAHHFDYRGLIEKGLAIDCTGLNIY